MISLFTLREKKALRIIVIITIVMRIAMMFRSEDHIFTRPIIEDSYYVFSCAEHLAIGEGFSVDGIHPTNGVQPLIAVLYTPLVLLSNFDKVLTIKLSFVLDAIIDSVSLILLAMLIQTMRKKKHEDEIVPLWKSPPIIAAFLWATSYSVVVHTLCGLETGIYSLLLILSLLLYARIIRSRSQDKEVHFSQLFVLGAVLGLTVLARIDAVILVGMICAYEVWTQKEAGLKNAIIIGIMAFIISSPWWWYNYSTFGSIMPQSGTAESFGIEYLRNIKSAIAVIFDTFTLFFYLPKAVEIPSIILVTWLILVGVTVPLLLKKTQAWKSVKSSFDFSILTPVAFTCIIFFFYYVFFFAAPHFISRYFQPLRILTLIIGCTMIPIMIEYFLRKRNGKMLLYGFAAIAFLHSFLRFGYYFTTTESSDLVKVGKWALKHPNEKVGMYQSGTAGYIAPNVINLDGKVNYQALLARKENDIGKYVTEIQCDYIADWNEFATEITESAKRHGMKYVLFDSIGRVMIYKKL